MPAAAVFVSLAPGGPAREAITTMSKKDEGQEAASDKIFQLAVGQFERVLMDLDATLKALETQADVTADTKAQAIDLRKTIQTVFEERHRLDKILEKNAGAHGGTGYDLDAARSEIGRRLARLRAAQPTDGVSEGPG